MYLEKFTSRFEQLKEYFPEEVLPCTEEQVHSIEEQCKLSLPTAYKEFLLWGEDPPVYGYKQGSAPELFAPVHFRKISPSYSQHLLEALEQEARLVRKWQEEDARNES